MVGPATLAVGHRVAGGRRAGVLRAGATPESAEAHPELSRTEGNEARRGTLTQTVFERRRTLRVARGPTETEETL